MRPTLPGFSVAPMTATFCGLKKTFSDWCLSIREEMAPKVEVGVEVGLSLKMSQGIEP